LESMGVEAVSRADWSLLLLRAHIQRIRRFLTPIQTRRIVAEAFLDTL